MSKISGVMVPFRRTRVDTDGEREKYPVPNELADYFGIAEDMIDRGETESAIVLLEGLLDEGYEHPWILSTLGRLYFSVKPSLARDGNVKAEGVLLAALRRYPDYAEAHRWLSVVYAWSNRLEEAAARAERAIELDPRSPENWNALGLLYLKRKNYDRALDYFLAAYGMDGAYLGGAYNIACCYANTGEHEKAFDFLEKAFESGKYVEKADRDEELKPIRGLPMFNVLVAAAKKRHGEKEAV
jgi:tetratricopeptide (TPR) repeat protein